MNSRRNNQQGRGSAHHWGVQAANQSPAPHTPQTDQGNQARACWTAPQGWAEEWWSLFFSFVAHSSTGLGMMEGGNEATNSPESRWLHFSTPHSQLEIQRNPNHLQDPRNLDVLCTPRQGQGVGQSDWPDPLFLPTPTKTHLLWWRKERRSWLTMSKPELSESCSLPHSPLSLSLSL